VRLDSLEKVRKEAARLYNTGRTGGMTTADCSRLAGVLDLIGRLLEKADLEARIAVLEAER
jgi:hypothetical protein